MRLLVINPNTTERMTREIDASARSVAAIDCEITTVSPSMGPASIESHYEEALAVPGVLERVAEGERDGVDGHVVACFGDPGLDAARELAHGPVLGIAEAAMHAATLVGRRFGVVTTLGRTIGRAEELVLRYGFERACIGVSAVEVPVLELDDPAGGARAALAAECRRHLDAGAHSVVLGCAGMAGFCSSLSREIDAPVIDGVAAAVGLVQGLVRAGLRTSWRDEYAVPPTKRFDGMLAGFGLGQPV